MTAQKIGHRGKAGERSAIVGSDRVARGPRPGKLGARRGQGDGALERGRGR